MCMSCAYYMSDIYRKYGDGELSKQLMSSINDLINAAFPGAASDSSSDTAETPADSAS